MKLGLELMSADDQSGEEEPLGLMGFPVILISRVRVILSRLEEQRRESDVSSDDYYELFGDMGHLSFTDWSKANMIFTDLAKQELDAALAEIRPRFHEQTNSRKSEVTSHISSVLNDKIRQISKSAEWWADRCDQISRRNFDSTEYFADVGTSLDDLGYVMEQIKDSNIELTSGIQASIKALDERLHVLLSQIDDAFRTAGDPLDPYDSDMFPSSFWWRRMNPTPTLD